MSDDPLWVLPERTEDEPWTVVVAWHDEEADDVDANTVCVNAPNVDAAIAMTYDTMIDTAMVEEEEDIVVVAVFRGEHQPVEHGH